MLSYFPQVRNEESTYSIFARLQFALQPLAMGHIGKILFGKNHEVGRLNFQGSFDYLCDNLPSSFTSESFLLNNTIYPVSKPFLSTKEQAKALKYFKSSNPVALRRCLRLSYIINDRTYIRICKECTREDIKFYGDPYYRRQHEIELNRMCHKHRIPLYEYTIYNYKLPRRYEDFFTVLSNLKEIFIPYEFTEKFLGIADDINALFSLKEEKWNIKLTNAKIITRLRELEYYSWKNNKPKPAHFEGFKKHYTEEFLNYIGYNFDQNTFDTFISNVNGSNQVEDPWMYILVIRYLFSSIEEFINYNKKYSEFPIPIIIITKFNNEYLD